VDEHGRPQADERKQHQADDEQQVLQSLRAPQPADQEVCQQQGDARVDRVEHQVQLRAVVAETQVRRAEDDRGAGRPRHPAGSRQRRRARARRAAGHRPPTGMREL
jgi:hypothetical protein